MFIHQNGTTAVPAIHYTILAICTKAVCHETDMHTCKPKYLLKTTGPTTISIVEQYDPSIQMKIEHCAYFYGSSIF